MGTPVSGLYRVHINKKLLDEEWTNRYLVTAGSLAAAHAVAGQIYAIERNIHAAIVTMVSYRTDDMVKDTDNYLVTDTSQPGLVAWGGFEHLPLFNVATVVLSVNTGRPSRKYLRLPLAEHDQVNGRLVAGKITHIMDNYVSPLVLVDALCDPQLQPIISGSVKPEVGMRQLRRKRKKKVAPTP